MRLLSQDIFTRHDGQPQGLFPGPVTYIRNREPQLLFRSGRESDSDCYDNWSDLISRDNGRTWNPPVLRHASRLTAGGRLHYSESGAFLDPKTDTVLFVGDLGCRPADMGMEHMRWSLLFTEYDARTNVYRELETTDFGLPDGIQVSFCNPLLTSGDRLLIPAMIPTRDAQGHFVKHPGAWDKSWSSLLILGSRRPDRYWTWTLSQAVTLPMDVCSRGLCEPTVAELKDDRIAMISRGSNDGFHERPGFKWLCFSSDGGATWTKPEPLRLDDHTLLESGANGSALIRSIKTGGLYWIGNPCSGGDRAADNWPRSPLSIYEIQESPFALKRASRLDIDWRKPPDASKTQLSNFRQYQDRETGDVVLLMCRLGEKTDADWRQADMHRYRIEI